MTKEQIKSIQDIRNGLSESWVRTTTDPLNLRNLYDHLAEVTSAVDLALAAIIKEEYTSEES